nr:hypothetical protein [Dermacoccus sp. Ellin185]
MNNPDRWCRSQFGDEALRSRFIAHDVGLGAQEVKLHRRGCAHEVARPHEVDDAPVLVNVARVHLEGVARAEEEQPHLDGEGAHHPIHDRVLSQRREPEMELGVRAADRAPVAALTRKLGPGDRGVDGVDQARVDGLGANGQITERTAFEVAAGRVDVVALGPLDAPDEDAAVRQMLDDPFVREDAERLSQRVATDTELSDEATLVEMTARRQFSVEDRAADAICRLFGL